MRCCGRCVQEVPVGILKGWHRTTFGNCAKGTLESNGFFSDRTGWRTSSRINLWRRLDLMPNLKGATGWKINQPSLWSKERFHNKLRRGFTKFNSLVKPCAPFVKPSVTISYAKREVFRVEHQTRKPYCFVVSEEIWENKERIFSLRTNNGRKSDEKTFTFTIRSGIMGFPSF